MSFPDKRHLYECSLLFLIIPGFISLGGEIAFSQTTNHYADYIELFNGSDLSGWDGDDRFWRVQDGVIIGETSQDNRPEANTFLIWKDPVSDFEISFEYRFVLDDRYQWGNSGLQIRSERISDSRYPDHDYIVRGYQADFATHDTWTGTFYEERGRGALAERGVIIYQCGEAEQVLRFADAELLETFFTHTDWNEYRVYAYGNTFRSWINGQLMNQYVDKTPDFRHEGILAFQLHSGAPMRIEFRNIRYRDLE